MVNVFETEEAKAPPLERLQRENEALQEGIWRNYGIKFDPKDWLRARPEILRRFFPNGRVPSDYEGLERLYQVQVDFIILNQYRDYYALTLSEKTIPPLLAPEPDLSQVPPIPLPPIPQDFREGKNLKIFSKLPIESSGRSTKGTLVVALPPEPEIHEKVFLPNFGPPPLDPQTQQLWREKFYRTRIDKLREGFFHVAGDNPYTSRALDGTSFEYNLQLLATTFLRPSLSEPIQRSGLADPWAYPRSIDRWIQVSNPTYLQKLNLAYEALLNESPKRRDPQDLLIWVVGRWMARRYRNSDGTPLKLEGVFADALLFEIARDPELRLDAKQDKKNLKAQIAKFEAHPHFQAWVEVCLYEQATLTGSPAPDGTKISYANRFQHLEVMNKLIARLGLNETRAARLRGLLRARAEAERRYSTEAGIGNASVLEARKNRYVRGSVLRDYPFEKLLARSHAENRLELRPEDLREIESPPGPPDWADWAKVKKRLDAPEPTDFQIHNLHLAGILGQKELATWTVLLPTGSRTPTQDGSIYLSEKEFARFLRELPGERAARVRLDTEEVRADRLAERLKKHPAPLLILVTHGLPGPTAFDAQAFAAGHPEIEIFRGFAEGPTKLLKGPVIVPEFTDTAAQCLCATSPKAATMMAGLRGKSEMAPNSLIADQLRLRQRDPDLPKLAGVATSSCDGVELAAELIADPRLKLGFSLGFEGKVNARWATLLLIEFQKRVDAGEPIKMALLGAQRSLLELAEQSKSDRELDEKLAWEVVENSYLFIRKDR